MQRRGRQAVAVELFAQAVGAVLGAGEHQHLMPAVFLDQVAEHCALARFFDHDHFLVDTIGGGVARRDVDLDRLVEQVRGELADILREGRREQQRLALFGHVLEHALDIVDEAHVEHAIGFVEHQRLDIRQVGMAFLKQIEQTPGCGHDDIHAFLELADLRLIADAAEDHGRANRTGLAIGAYGFVDLGGEFARRREHQYPRFLLLGLAQAMQQRQGEGSGLAGAGLGGGKHVLALEYGRNGLGLDGRGFAVTGGGHGFEKRRRQAELIKGHRDSFPLNCGTS